MTKRNLEIFVEVAQCGNMTKVAKKLYITQSSVSQAISELEKKYNVLLFERFSKKIYITSEGRKMLEYAQQILSLYSQMEADFKKETGLITLQIGATIAIGTYIMNELAQNLFDKMPYVTSDLTIDYGKNLISKLLENKLDVILIEGEINHPDLVSFPFIKNRLVLICGKMHPFFIKKKVTLDNINNQPFVLKEKGSRVRSILENILAKDNINIYERWTCNNSAALKNAVINNRVLSYISEIQVKNECENGNLQIINIPELFYDWNICVVYHKNKYFTPELSQFIELCENYHSPKKML